MGYYSEFKVDGTSFNNPKAILDSISVYTWEDDDYGVYLSSAKWYDWLRDLEKLARDYPDDYIVILRYGEEGGDISRAVMANGKVVEQHPQFVWPAVQLGKGDSSNSTVRTIYATEEEVNQETSWIR